MFLKLPCLDLDWSGFSLVLSGSIKIYVGARAKRGLITVSNHASVIDSVLCIPYINF